MQYCAVSIMVSMVSFIVFGERSEKCMVLLVSTTGLVGFSKMPYWYGMLLNNVGMFFFYWQVDYGKMYDF